MRRRCPTEESDLFQNLTAFEPYPDVERLLEWLEGRYGIESAVFDQYRFWHRPPSPAIWVAHVKCTPCCLHLESLGLTALRMPPPRGMLCNVFAQKFGAFATKHVVILTETQAARYLARETVLLEQDTSLTQGFVIVRRADRVLGCGKVTAHSLESELPRAWIQ